MWAAIMADTPEAPMSDYELRTVANAQQTLRHEDHKKIAEQLVEVRRNSLHIIQDLRDAGLVVPFEMHQTLAGFENLNSFSEAQSSLNPVEFNGNDTNFQETYIPLPLHHSTWTIPALQIGLAYKRTAGLSESVRMVAEKMERAVFDGDAAIVADVGGSKVPLYGLTTHPNRLTETVTNWASSTTAVLTDVAKLRAKMNTASTSDQDTCILYVPYDWYTVLGEDAFANKGDLTFIERIKNYPEIKDVKPSKFLSSEVVLVELTDRTIQLAEASDIVTFPHLRMSEAHGQTFTTMSKCAPFIKVDRNGKTGIVHGTV